MKDDYLIIGKKSLESWVSDCRSNPENFMSGYLYEFGRSGFETLDLLKSQLEKAEEVILEYNSNYDYYCCELAGSWSEIRKKAREYFSEKADK